MIDCDAYVELLESVGIRFFTGVPDSLLKDFYACVSDRIDRSRDLIAANEGAAVALAAGHHLATGELGLVYLQNSGVGNLVNPLTSLVDPEVYSIPVLLLIGWRGEPGRPDEPQHVKQGRVTAALLDALEIPHRIHPETLEEARETLTQAVEQMRREQAPHALIVRAGTFAPYTRRGSSPAPYEMAREEAIIEVVRHLDPDDVIVSTTGKTSRELFTYRADAGEPHDRDFLTVGSMGHASQIALAIALARPRRQVFCLDGDGALIMHMGAMAIAGGHGSSNFKHIVVNNGVHDSVGGQPTVAFQLDLPAIARACGYRKARCVEHRAEVAQAVQELRAATGPALLEIRTNPGARSDLGRPTLRPVDNKRGFMQNLDR